MALFKTKEQRRMERDLEIRKALNQIQRQIKEQQKGETNYLGLAVQAKEIGDAKSLALCRRAIRTTQRQKKMLQEQLLTIQFAMQAKKQAESNTMFAKAMSAVSKSIADLFTETDLVKVQKDFESAMQKTQSMEERMNLFLDMSMENMFLESDSGFEADDDSEVDTLIEAHAIRKSKKIQPVSSDETVDDEIRRMEEEIKRRR